MMFRCSSRDRKTAPTLDNIAETYRNATDQIPIKD